MRNLHSRKIFRLERPDFVLKVCSRYLLQCRQSQFELHMCSLRRGDGSFCLVGREQLPSLPKRILFHLGRPDDMQPVRPRYFLDQDRRQQQRHLRDLRPREMVRQFGSLFMR